MYIRHTLKFLILFIFSNERFFINLLNYFQHYFVPIYHYIISKSSVLILRSLKLVIKWLPIRLKLTPHAWIAYGQHLTHFSCRSFHGESEISLYHLTPIILQLFLTILLFLQWSIRIHCFVYHRYLQLIPKIIYSFYLIMAPKHKRIDASNSDILNK